LNICFRRSQNSYQHHFEYNPYIHLNIFNKKPPSNEYGRVHQGKTQTWLHFIKNKIILESNQCNRPSKEAGLVTLELKVCNQLWGLVLVSVGSPTLGHFLNYSPSINFSLKSASFSNKEPSQMRRQGGNRALEFMCWHTQIWASITNSLNDSEKVTTLFHPWFVFLENKESYGHVQCNCKDYWGISFYPDTLTGMKQWDKVLNKCNLPPTSL
jgi:hypothetical protein